MIVNIVAGTFSWLPALKTVPPEKVVQFLKSDIFGVLEYPYISLIEFSQTYHPFSKGTIYGTTGQEKLTGTLKK